MHVDQVLQGNRILIEVPLFKLLHFIREHSVTRDGSPFPSAAAELMLLGQQSRRMFSRSNLAAMLDVSEATIRTLERNGMPVVRRKGLTRYYLDEVQLWLSGDADGCQRLVESRGGKWVKSTDKKKGT